MAQLVPALLNSIYYNLNSLFQGVYENTEVWWDKIAMSVPSSTRENRYGWMDKIPRMRQWVGPRVKNSVSARAYSLVNNDYELTQALDRNDIEDDTLGLFTPLVAMMADQARKWPDDMLLLVIQGGATQIAYDGVPFFSLSHPVNIDNAAFGTYANLHQGGFTLSSQNLNVVMAEMRTRLGADGKMLRIKPIALVCAPGLEISARQILFGTTTAPAQATGQNAAAAQQDNVLRGAVDLIIIEDLAALEPNVWYLIGAVANTVKPFVVQIRKAPEFVTYTSPNDPNVFNNKEFIYGCDARGAAGVTFPFLCTRCEG